MLVYALETSEFSLHHKSCHFFHIGVTSGSTTDLYTHPSSSSIVAYCRQLDILNIIPAYYEGGEGDNSRQ